MDNPSLQPFVYTGSSDVLDLVARRNNICDKGDRNGICCHFIINSWIFRTNLKKSTLFVPVLVPRTSWTPFLSRRWCNSNLSLLQRICLNSFGLGSGLCWIRVIGPRLIRKSDVQGVSYLVTEVEWSTGLLKQFYVIVLQSVSYWEDRCNVSR